MTPIQAISMLDTALERNGEDILLTRNTLGAGGVQTPTTVQCRAQVMGYQPQELISGSGIVAGDSKVILSPTQIDEAGWPGDLPSNPRGDPRVLAKGDQIVMGGRTVTVQGCAARRLAGVLVRLEAQVRG